MTIAKQVREYKAANPSATNVEIAKIFKTSPPYVWQALNTLKVAKSKAQTRAKAKAIAKPVNLVRNIQVENLQLECKFLRGEIDILKEVVKACDTQRRGLENVITYLETKLGIDEIDARLEATR
jgi:hypothetical protein